jgi:hypothetical protein
MGNSSEQVSLLCISCEYGRFFRAVKYVDGIPYDEVRYTCSTIEGTPGPCAWNGYTCYNFVGRPVPTFDALPVL